MATQDIGKAAKELAKLERKLSKLKERKGLAIAKATQKAEKAFDEKIAEVQTTVDAAKDNLKKLAAAA
jgi:hypothetical protein